MPLVRTVVSLRSLTGLIIDGTICLCRLCCRRPIYIVLPMLLLVMTGLTVSGQDLPPHLPGFLKYLPHPHPPMHGHEPPRPMAVDRWTISFNPLGLVEPPAAIGFGIGYRLNENVEIWSETSLLRNLVLPVGSSLTGLRQILQVKRFLGRKHIFFIAGEARYKSSSYRDSGNFFNPVARDTLFNAGYHTRHYFWGAGLQAGARFGLSKNGRFGLELTAGLGFKQKMIERQSNGNQYLDYRTHIDINIRDFTDVTGGSVYFPGSLRLIYTFGKRLP